MTRNRLLLSGTGIAAAGLILVTAFGFYKDGQSLYHPSQVAEKMAIGGGEEEDFHGAAEWNFNRMKNNVTGDIDPAEVIAVQERAQHTLNAARTGGPQQTTSTVQWNEIGPDNVGGRTRAILIDQANSQHMFAGGVSGGLWESNDGANNWHRVDGFFNVAGVNINVVTIAQAPNGNLFVGTGEGNFYSPFGTGAGGFIGGGMYTSTDGGVTWSLVSSAAPTTANSTAAAWANINKIAIDPNNSDHIYAATNKGFKISTDGGLTWASATGPATSSVCTDVDVTNNGRVIAVVANKPWLSTDNGVSFTNVGTTANGFFTQNPTRTEIAIAPSDPNYVYAFCAQGTGSLLGLAASVDGGNTWTIVTGAGNSQFDPFSSNSQGTYDNCLAVDPTDRGRVILGGVELWEWQMVINNPPAGQWTRIALEFPASPFNPYYVHSDKHAIVFSPTTPTTFFVGCDGGIFRTLNNGQTYQAMNAGYNVTQCYSVAFDHTSLNRSIAMAGCQDNGTQYVDGLGNTSMSAAAVGGGDGAYCDISYLNPSAIFGTVYYGSLARSNNGGGSSSAFYSDRITGLANFTQPGFASFVTPIRLWESTNDVLSGDSFAYHNATRFYSAHVGDGSTTTFTGTIPVAPVGFTASPDPTVVLNSVRFGCNGDTLNSDAAGNIQGNGSGTVGSTGTYTVTFNSAPASGQIVRVYFDETFGAGTTYIVNSNVQGKMITHTSSSAVNPGEWLKIQDPIQSRLAVGFAGNNGIWITRRPIDFSTTPEWIKIGGTHSTPSAYSGECETMAWSADGNYLYVGTSNGTVFRFSNLGSVVDSANGDIDNGSSASNPNCISRCQLIGSFSGRWVTGIDVDPNDAGRVIVTVGNYSNTSYVYFSQTADTASSISAAAFADKTGNLDNLGGVPTYSVSFDKYTPNRVLVGTEHGVYETTNITAGAPTWATAMGGLDNVVVDQIRQQRFDPWLVPNSGCFYIGTHGRGMWRDDSSWQQPTGISNPSQGGSVGSTAGNNDLHVFPNPVVENSNVTFQLGKAGDATVDIYDLTGKLVYTKKYEQLGSGVNTVQFEAGNLVKGTYIIRVSQGAKNIGTGRFIKMN